MSINVNGSVIIDNNCNLVDAADAVFTGTSHLKLPSGTTAQRPSVAVPGMLRYNVTLGAFEGVSSAGWGPISTVQSSGRNVVTGDTVNTVATLSPPDWLLADGSVYAQADYPALYNQLGALNDYSVLLSTATTWLSVASSVSAVKFSPNSQYVATGHSSTAPYGQINKRSATNTFSTVTSVPGFSTSTPYVANSRCIAWSPNSNHVAWVRNDSRANSGCVEIWARNGDVFSSLGVPQNFTATNYSQTMIGYSPQGDRFIIQTSSLPSVMLYSVSGNTYTNLIPEWSGNFVPSPGANPQPAFSPSGNHVCLVSSTSLYILKKTTNSYSTLTNFTTTANGANVSTIRTSTYTPDGKFLVVGGDGTPFLAVYRVSGDTYTRDDGVVDVLPGNLLSGTNIMDIRFTPDGKTMICAHGTSGLVAPWFTLYKYDGSKFYRLLAPASWPTATIGMFAFDISSDGDLIAMSNASAVPKVKMFGTDYNRLTHFKTPQIDGTWDNSITPTFNTYIKT